MSRLFRAYSVGSASGSSVLRVDYPASSWIGDANEITWEGTMGGTLCGTFHTVGAFYPYFTQDDGSGRFIGVDPGDFEAGLAGFTGVEIQLAAGTQTAAQVSATLETQWNAAGTGITATDNGGGQVDYAGAFDPTAAVTGSAWTTRGAGTSAYGATELNVSVSTSALDFRSAVQVEEAALPVGTFRVVGVRYRGNTLRMAVAINGTARGNPQGATVQWEGFVAGGGTDWRTHWLTPAECFEVDGSTLNELFIVVDGDGALSGIEGGVAQDDGLQADGSGDNVFRLGVNQGSGTPITSPLGALSGGNFNFGLSMQVIVQVAPYYGDGNWQSYGGMSPEIVAVPPNTTPVDQIWVAFGFDFPAVTGLEIQSLQLYLPAHDAALDDQLRAELWDNAGAMSTITVVGDTIYDDIGPTSGTDTGWVEILSSPIAIDGGGEYRLSLKGEPAAPNDTTFGFTLGGYGENVEMPGWPLAATMEASEIEYTVAGGETNIDMDPQVATTSPLNPNSAAIFPGNAGGMAVRIGHPGFVLTPNP